MKEKIKAFFANIGKRLRAFFEGALVATTELYDYPWFNGLSVFVISILCLMEPGYGAFIMMVWLLLFVFFANKVPFDKRD